MNINARDVYCKTHIISSSHREPEGSRASVSYRLYAYVHFLSVFIVEHRASVSVAIFFVRIQGKACIQIRSRYYQGISKKVAQIWLSDICKGRESWRLVDEDWCLKIIQHVKIYWIPGTHQGFLSRTEVGVSQDQHRRHARKWISGKTDLRAGLSDT